MQAPHHIQNYRYEQCKVCPSPCEHQKDVAWRAEGLNSCPIGRFMVHETFKRTQLRGMGDVVALVAEPIAALSDKVLKTKIRGCAGCRKRREMMNTLMPFYKI